MRQMIEINRLEKIIEETVSEFLNEAALCHSPSTGHFAKCEPGAVYSLSDKGAKSAGVDKKYVARGKVGKKGKKEDGSYSVTAKMGTNFGKKQAGRMKMTKGDEISPKYSVSKYPETYNEEKTEWDPDWKSAKKRKKDHQIMKPSHSSWTAGAEELSQTARGVGLGLFEQDGLIDFKTLKTIIEDTFPSEPLSEGLSDFKSKCRAQGLISMGEAQERILRALNNFSKAQDGKLFEPQS